MSSHRRVSQHEYTDSGLDANDMSSSGMDNQLSWIEWYCKLKENRFFVEVEEDYVRDDFNLTGLGSMVPHYLKALDTILDSDEEDASDDSEGESNEILNRSVALLYGLIHARYIITSAGLQAMLAKYEEKVYGVCPNTFCHEQPVMPMGLSDHPKVHTAVVYCPSCREVYWPLNRVLAGIDGAYFGTTFTNLFFMQYPNALLKPPLTTYFVPAVFGFKVSPLCREITEDNQTAGSAAVKNVNTGTADVSGAVTGQLQQSRVHQNSSTNVAAPWK